MSQEPKIGLPAENTKGKNHFAPAVFLTFVVISLCANIVYTQRLAHLFGYDQRALGPALFWKVFQPFAWVRWVRAYREIYPGPLAFHAAYIFGGAFVAAMLAYLVIALSTRRAKAIANLHGSARWAGIDDIQETGLLPKPGAKPEPSVYVGAWKDPKRGTIKYLMHSGPEHILTFAPTRSGKGVGLVIPSLLGYTESVVILDIKGENYALTAGWRKSIGQLIFKFDPMDTTGTATRYNPLAELRLGTEHEIADAQNIVTMIVDPDGNGLPTHWDKTSFMFLVGVVLHVCYLHKVAGQTATLPDVAAALSREEGINALYADMKHNTHLDGQPHTVVMRSSIDMLEKEERERGSVLSTAKTFFAIYADPVLARNIGKSDFKLTDLMQHEKPASLYLVIDPGNKERLKPIIRLIFAQVVRNLTPRMEFKDGRAVRRYKHRLLLMLDEFPTLGKIPIFVDALAHIAGYGIKVFIIAQDLSQLYAAYGKEESISSNCHIRIAYAPNKIETAEVLSKMTGTATIVKRVQTTSGGRLGMTLGQTSESLQEFSRPLLTPDECLKLPGAVKLADGTIIEAGDMLVFAAGFPPIYGKQILFFKDPVLSARSRLPSPARPDKL
jgi:type IV secretion system protein VirD4